MKFPLKTAEPDLKFWKILGQNGGGCFGENFVTPFATLATNKSSLPTIFDHARSIAIRYPPLSEPPVKIFLAFGQQLFFEHRQKTVYLSDSDLYSDDLHPKTSP